MTTDEALKAALEALEAHADIGIKSDKAITAIKEALAQPDERGRCTHGVWIADHCYKCALAQPEQGSVAWECLAGGLKKLTDQQYKLQQPSIQQHYTQIPPKREWVGLSINELAALIVKTVGYPIKLAEGIEAALKEKNYD